jgi:hypothetical protein
MGLEVKEGRKETAIWQAGVWIPEFIEEWVD